MAKKRVHEIAKAQGLTSKELLAKLKAAGVEAKAAQSSVEESDALAALKGSGDGASAATATKTKPAPKKKTETAPKAKAEAPCTKSSATRTADGSTAAATAPPPRLPRRAPPNAAAVS